MQAEFDRRKLERDIEFEKHKQMLKEKQITDMKLEKEKKQLEQNLAKYVPMIIESNLIARELKKEVSFSPYLAYHFSDIHDVNEEMKEEGSKHLTMKVKVDNHAAGYFYIWSLEKFFDRYFMIKELLDDYFGSNELPVLADEVDPFWDPPEPILLGQGFLKLLSIAYLLDSPTDLILVGDEGQTGTLAVYPSYIGQLGARKRPRRSH
jgi:kinesin family protein 13